MHPFIAAPARHVRRLAAAVAIATVAASALSVTATTASAQTASYLNVIGPAGYPNASLQYQGPNGTWWGESWTSDYSNSINFFWRNGAIIAVFDPADYGWVDIQLTMSNDAGVWIGYGTPADGYEVAIRWDAANGIQRLDATTVHPGSHQRAQSIGNNGVIFGADNSLDGIACIVWDATGRHELATPTGGNCWPATGSPSGQYFTGDAIDANGVDNGFRWDAVNGMRFFGGDRICGTSVLDDGRVMGSNCNNKLATADPDGTVHAIGVENPDAMFGFWYFQGGLPNKVGMYAGSYFSMFGGGADSLRGPWLIEPNGTNTRLPLTYAYGVNNRGQVLGVDSSGIDGYWDKVNGFRPFGMIPGFTFGPQQLTDDGTVYGGLYDDNGFVRNIVVTGLDMPPLLGGGGSNPPPDVTAPVVTVPANMNRAATTLTGTTVTYAVSATDDRDGAVAASCSKASGSAFTIGTTTVTCSATDAAGNTGTASFTVTVDNVVPGDIEGEGKFTAGDTKTEFEFHVFESSRKLNGQLELNITTKPARPGKTVENKFKSTNILTAVFSDDPAFNARSKRTPVSDNVTFTGMGKWNGTAGYSYSVTALDASRKRGQDTVSITVRDAVGVVVAQVSGTLSNGQVESHRVPGSKH